MVLLLLSDATSSASGCVFGRVEGGQYLKGQIMIVKRIDIYDFEIHLTEMDFLTLSQIADVLHKTIEDTLLYVIRKRIIETLTNLKLKG